MKFEKKDALWLVLSVVLSIFIIGVFVSQALSWAFADDATVEDMGYDAFVNTYWNTDTHGDIFIKTESPISCLYFDSDRGITMYSTTENSFIGSYWYSGEGLTIYNQNTSGTGPFSLGQDGFYNFFVSSRQITPKSNYPIFDDAGYALQYLNGDDSVLQYAINLEDLPLSLDDQLQGYISNVYFSYLGSSSAQFQVELSPDCPEGLDLEITPTSIAYVYGESDSGIKLTSKDFSKCPASVYNSALSSDSYFDIDVPAVYHESSDGTSIANGYVITAKDVRGDYPFVVVDDRFITNTGAKIYVGGLYYSNASNLNYITSPSSVFNGVVSMDLDSGITIPSGESSLPFQTWNTIGCSPVAFQIRCRIINRNTGALASASPYVYLTATIDGSVMVTNGLINVPKNPGQNITKKDSNGLSFTTPTNTSGIEGFENGTIDNSNIIPYIQSGFGLSGNNGLIAMYRQVFNFLPSEIWAMIFFALGLSIILMVIKILRGM